ncbi:MAG: STAS domain-containing protein [Bdellovibrionales bacterium]
METSVKKQGEWAVVRIKGRIELEKTQMFREACLKSLVQQKVIFVLEGLQFVGSTGMTEFFQCLSDVQTLNQCGVHIVGLSADFKRFVSFTSASSLRIHETLDEVFRSPLAQTDMVQGESIVETATVTPQTTSTTES